METDFAIPGAISSPSGVCPTHGTMIFRNGLPHCLQCSAAAAKGVAGNVVAEVETKPAPDEINRPKPHLREPDFEKQVSTEAAGALQGKRTIYELDDNPIKTALNVLRTVPMPKDLKQFKTIQKAIALLEKASGQEEI